MENLLSREEFREAVFSRDGGVCVICKVQGVEKKAKDAHHIIERRLFHDGGYYLSNGASLCDVHHIHAEGTALTCEEIRVAAGITELIIPEHLYAEQRIDKWGNAILDNGMRTQGELFQDESVQKILKEFNILGIFSDKIKYPRTYHLPWSPNMTKDERKIPDEYIDSWEGKEVVITEKMDGENTSMYKTGIHARALQYTSMVHREWVKTLHARVRADIPENWRVCGENMFAKHAIHYKQLASYFLVFSIWNEKNECLSWDDTLEWCELLSLKMVPHGTRQIYTRDYGKELKESMDFHTGNSPIAMKECEGFVIRLTESFHFKEFRQSVAKYVRKGHVPLHGGHWSNNILVRNELKDGFRSPYYG